MPKNNKVLLLAFVICMCFLLPASKASAAFVITADKTDQINSLFLPDKTWQDNHYSIDSISISQEQITIKGDENNSNINIVICYNSPDTNAKELNCIKKLSENVDFCIASSSPQITNKALEYFTWLQKGEKKRAYNSLWTEITEKPQAPSPKPLDREYFKQLTLEKKAQLKNLIIKSHTPDQLVWWAWPSVILAFIIFAFFVLLPYRKNKATYLAGVKITLASIISRALIPNVLMHVQTDDLNIVASARNLVNLVDTHSHAGNLLDSVRFLFTLWGENIESVFLIAHLFGAMLPLLAFVLSLEWFKDRQIAIVSAILVLISPVAIAYSGAITAYMPMSAVFGLSIFMALLTLRVPLSKGILLSPLITVLIIFTVLLKEEFIFLLLAYPIFIIGSYYFEEHQHRSLIKLILSLTPPVITAIFIFTTANLFLVEINHNMHERSMRLITTMFFSISSYYFCFLYIIPPMLPVKLAVFLSVITKENRNTVPLLLVILLLGNIFAFASQTVGFNQWRYSLMYLFPLYLAASPTVCKWWREKKDVRFARMMIILILCFNLVPYAEYAQQANSLRQREFRYIQNLKYDPDALIIYFPLVSDMSPVNLLAATGKADIIPLDNLFPVSCDFGAKIRKVPLRQQWVSTIKTWDKEHEISLEKKMEPDYFFHVDNFENDLKWMEKNYPNSPNWIKEKLESIKHSIFAIDELNDKPRCEKHRKTILKILSRYKKMYLFIDSGFIEDEEVIPRKYCENFKEFMDISEDYFVLDKKPQLDEYELVLVKMILDPECGKGVKDSYDCIIWSMK